MVSDMIKAAASIDISLCVTQLPLSDASCKANVESLLGLEIAVDVVSFHKLSNETQDGAFVIDDVESLVWSMNTSITAEYTARVRTNVACIATTRARDGFSCLQDKNVIWFKARLDDFERYERPRKIRTDDCVSGLEWQ
jgi:hypothetical protein